MLVKQVTITSKAVDIQLTQDEAISICEVLRQGLGQKLGPSLTLQDHHRGCALLSAIEDARK